MSLGGRRRKFILLCLWGFWVGWGVWRFEDVLTKMRCREALYMARGRDEKKEEKK